MTNDRAWFTKIKFRWLTLFFLVTACIERIDFDSPDTEFMTVVDGMITDAPGPYTIKMSKSFSIDVDSIPSLPVQGAIVTLFDDEGNTEAFTETSPGNYATTGVIRGKIGHRYHIRIETANGSIFESEPDEIRPVGEVDGIHFEFEKRTREETYGDVDASVFKIFADAHAAEGTDNYMRWKFMGTYETITHPELHTTFLQCSYFLTPYPCSGYDVGPALGGGKLEKIGDCTCCDCWVNEFETMPILSDVQLVSNNTFKNVPITEVAITPAIFYNKYRVQIQQMSLTRQAFDFFKLIRAQKESASSLFQPQSGEIRGNIHSVSGNAKAIGIFWATAVSEKSIYILKSDVPYALSPYFAPPEPCDTFYKNSSTTKPAFWE
jgi:hypothetical protein